MQNGIELTIHFKLLRITEGGRYLINIRLITRLIAIGDIIRFKYWHVAAKNATFLIEATDATLVMSKDDPFMQIVEIDRGPHISLTVLCQLYVSSALLIHNSLNIAFLLNMIIWHSATFIGLKWLPQMTISVIILSNLLLFWLISVIGIAVVIFGDFSFGYDFHNFV